MFTFASYNTKDYRRNEEALSRALLVEQVIYELGAGAIALQETPGHNRKRAAEDLKRLAQATGMEYLMPGLKGEEPQPAFAIGHYDLSVALLWNPEVVRPIPGTLQTYEKDFWHALLLGEFEIEGRRVALASSHAPSRAGHEYRVPEARQLVQFLGGYELALLGQDRNSVGADTKTDGTYYDPDPYQPDARAKPSGELPETAFPTDRTPGAILTEGGLIDVAPHLGVPWEPTTGHWPDECNGYRRIDEIRASRALVEQVLTFQVIRSPFALEASDHVPIKAGINVAAA